MDKKFELKKLGLGLLCLLVAALIIVNIFQYQQIKKTTQNLSSKSTLAGESKTSGASSDLISSDNVSPLPKKIVKKAAFSSDKDDDLNYQLDAAEEELDMVNKKLSDEDAKKLEAKKLQKEIMKKSMQDPSTKKYMRQSLYFQYADLFKKLNLSVDKLEKFKDILVDEQTAQQDLYADSGSDYGTLSKEKRKELNERYNPS